MTVKNNTLGAAVVKAARKDYAGFKEEVDKVLAAKMQVAVEDSVALAKQTLFKQGD